MALPKIYNPIIFSNDSPPALNEDNLNEMSEALNDIDNRVIMIAGDVVEKAAQIIELGENPPYIGANGNWYIWDTDTGEYVDSGIDASITITIADVSMLPSGSSPYVTNTGTSTDPIFHLYIPIAEGDYDQLTNRPKINSATLTGNKRGSQMGIVDWRDAIRQSHTMTSGIASVALKKGEIVYYVGSNPALFRLNVDVALGNNWIQNSTAVTFEELINELTTGLSNELITRSELGAHNILQSNAVSEIKNGVTFTVNNDKSITVSTGSGGATANSIIGVNTKIQIPAGSYIISSDYHANNCYLSIEAYNGNTWISALANTKTGDASVTLDYNGYDHVRIYLIVTSGAIYTTSVTIKPMIRLATDADATYRPYAMTNKQLTDNKVGWDDNSKLGAKNLLPCTMTSHSRSGVSATVNADGTVTLNNTATAGNIFPVADSNLSLKAGTYTFTCLQQPGSDGTFKAWVSNLGDYTNYFDYGNGVTFTVPNDKSNVYVGIGFASGVSFNNQVFKPMIRLASDSDSTYQPYAKTNKQLTDNVTDIEAAIAPIEIGTASQAYDKGDYLIMNDKLYKANTAIVSGATLIVGTNVEQTSVGDALKKTSETIENSTYLNATIKVKKQADVVTISYSDDIKKINSTSGIIFGTISEEFRPNESKWAYVRISPTIVAWITVRTDGQIKLFANATQNTIDNCQFTLTYVI